MHSLCIPKRGFENLHLSSEATQWPEKKKKIIKKSLHPANSDSGTPAHAVNQSADCHRLRG